MAHKIAIYNNKGGVGKTTIGANLASALAVTEKPDGTPYRVLLIDMDPQGNSTEFLWLSREWRAEEDKDRDFGLLITEDKPISSVIYNYKAREFVRPNVEGDDVYEVTFLKDVTEDGQEINTVQRFRLKEYPNFGVVPAYTRIGMGKNPKTGQWYDEDEIRAGLPVDFLSKKLAEIENNYDFILWDCPPSWDRFSKMAIFASDQIIIPIRPGKFELDGIIGVGEKLEYFEEQYGKRPQLIFAIMNAVRGGVKGHQAYIRKNTLALEGLISSNGVPFTEEVTNSIDQYTPFVFARGKYPVMADTFLDIAKEIIAKYNAKEKVNG